MKIPDMEKMSEAIQKASEQRKTERENYVKDFMQQVKEGDRVNQKVLRIAKYISGTMFKQVVFEKQSKSAQYEIIQQAFRMYKSYNEVKMLLHKHQVHPVKNEAEYIESVASKTAEELVREVVDNIPKDRCNFVVGAIIDNLVGRRSYLFTRKKRRS